MTDDARGQWPPDRSPGGGSLGAGADTAAARSRRSWIRFSMVIRCIRCGRRWQLMARRPGCRRAAPGILSWPCTSWPPTRSAMAPGTAGCGCGDTGRGARCEVTDDGAPKAADGGAETGSRDAALWPIEPGHGLWLTRQVADQASVQAGPSGTVAAVSFAPGPPGKLTPFRLDQRFRDGCAVVSVTGELDLGSAGQFASAVGEPDRGDPRLAPGAGSVRPDLVGFLWPGRADHRPAVGQRPTPLPGWWWRACLDTSSSGCGPQGWTASSPWPGPPLTPWACSPRRADLVAVRGWPAVLGSVRRGWHGLGVGGRPCAARIID